jgi:hypothetical protein
MSTVLETVILTSVLIAIVFTAAYVANNAINGQIENAQFNQAENVMLALNQLITRLIYQPESSGYIETSFWTVTPYFVQTGQNLIIKVLKGGQQISGLQATVPVNIVKIEGGSRASVAAKQNLIGNENLILTSISDSLGLVQIYQSVGAWISLDYSRVRCINNGVIQYWNGTGYQPYNFIEITVIKITFKDFFAEQQASFTAKNTGLVPIQNNTNTAGDFTILVQKSDGTSNTCTLSSLGGNINYKTLINMVVVNIEISLEGG